MQSRKMMGLEIPGDERVPVPARDWRGMKLALWRSKAAWEMAECAAREIVERCKHVEGCPGAVVETEPCLPYRYEKSPQGVDETDEAYTKRPGALVQQGCPDREQRMSALTILNAARMFGPIDARRPADEPYYAPSREYFSEVLGDLGAAQAELEVLRGGVQQVTLPTPNEQEPT
jgi:hypothetical protein